MSYPFTNVGDTTYIDPTFIFTMIFIWTAGMILIGFFVGRWSKDRSLLGWLRRH